MLVLRTNLRVPDRLMFSPDGQALLATEGSTVQLWPRWLDARPRAPKKVRPTLERCALSPDGSRVYLYSSGNSYTRVLDWKRGQERATALPSGGPSWFHFDTASGFILVSQNRNNLTRFDLAPELKAGVRKRWWITRPYAGSGAPNDGPSTIGSHFRFGAICAAAGVFVALEYRSGPGEPFDGLVVRSVADGALIHREVMPEKEAETLKEAAGLTLSVHPSGRYFAYPQDACVRFRSIAAGVSTPADLTPAAGRQCRGVAFHPSGAVLAAVGDSGTATLYDTATWRVAREFAWDIGALRAVCFSPDGTRAATIAVGAAPERRKRAVGRAVVWDMDL